MAVSNQEIIYTVKADTGEIEKALETVSKDAEKTASSVDDVGKSMDKTGDATNILTEKLDNLTGGAISGFKSAATSTKSFITGLKLTRAAIIATGIGALVVGVVALVQQFAKTEEGARKMAKAFAPVRAVIDVLQQKISALGGAIFKLFTGDFRGAADDFTKAISNQNDEYQRQVDLYTELTEREQALEDARIRQTVATAKTRAEIKELNLVAEDLTKSIDEREAAAERAGQLERALFEERKRIAEEELAIAQARLESSNTTTEDRERVAQLEAEIFQLAQESLELQTTLNNKLNTIRAEGLRQQQEQLDLLRELNEELQEGRVEVEEVEQDIEERTLQGQVRQTEIVESESQKRRRIRQEEFEVFKEFVLKDQETVLNFAQGTLATLSELNEAFAGETEAEQKKAFDRGKKVAIAQTLISTYESATAAFKSLVGIPVVGPALGAAAAIAATATGLANVKRIKSQQFQAGGTGGGAASTSSPSPSLSGAATQATQAPQAPQIDLSFLGEGAVSEAPIQAYVISQDVSNAQQANQQIQEQAQL